MVGLLHPGRRDDLITETALSASFTLGSHGCRHDDAMRNLLEMHEVSRRYGVTPNEVVALNGVSLSVVAGEMVAIMGPSGSGKSTLLMIAGALEVPSAGIVEVDGVDLSGLDTTALAEVRRRRVGFVFQGYNLLSGLTAAENIAAPLELDGVGARTARGEAMARLTAVQLDDRANAFPVDLSGGEQQRVAIARGLVGDRRLLLADEPTGALDQQTGAVVMRLLREACTAEAAVVIVTHDPVIAGWADRVVQLRDGSVNHEVLA